MFPWNELVFWELGGIRSLGGLITAGFGTAERAVSLIAKSPFLMEIPLSVANGVVGLVKNAIDAAGRWFMSGKIPTDDLPIIPTPQYGNIDGGFPGQVNVDVLASNSDRSLKPDSRLINFSTDLKTFESEFWEAYRMRLEEMVKAGDDTVTIDDVFIPGFNVFAPITLWRNS